MSQSHAESGERVARSLLRIGAVALRPDDPFTWASGRLSPIYTDNRLALAFPDVRDQLVEAFVERARAVAPDLIAGTATAGIPLATLLADRLRLPLCYVRAAAKAHGRQNRVEGRVEPGQHVVVVEDLVSTGGSVLAAAEALRDAGAVPVTALAVFSYGLPEADRAFREAGLPLDTLTTFDTLVRVAAADGTMSPEAVESLSAWRADPAAWSVSRGGAA